MLKFSIILLLSLMLFRPVAAHDTGNYTVGWIAGVDELYDKVILDDGRSYVVSPEINFEMLAPGRKVKLVLVATPWGRVVADIIPIASESARGGALGSL